MAWTLEELQEEQKRRSGARAPGEVRSSPEGGKPGIRQISKPEKPQMLGKSIGLGLTPHIAPEPEPAGYAGIIGRGLTRGVQGIAAGIGSIAHMAGELSGIDPLAEAGETASDYWMKAATEGKFKADEEVFQGTFLENPSFKRATGIVAEAFPSYGAAIIASVASGNPLVGAAFLGALEGAPQYEEAREAGKGKGSAAASGVTSMVGTTLLEYLPIARMLKYGKKPLSKIAKKSLLKPGFITGTLKGGTEEAAQEASQTVFQNLVAKVGYDDSRALTEGIIEAIIGGAGTGGLVGGTATKLNQAALRARERGATDEELDAAVTQTSDEINDFINTRVRDETLGFLRAGKNDKGNNFTIQDALLLGDVFRMKGREDLAASAEDAIRQYQGELEDRKTAPLETAAVAAEEQEAEDATEIREDQEQITPEGPISEEIEKDSGDQVQPGEEAGAGTGITAQPGAGEKEEGPEPETVQTQADLGLAGVDTVSPEISEEGKGRKDSEAKITEKLEAENKALAAQMSYKAYKAMREEGTGRYGPTEGAEKFIKKINKDHKTAVKEAVEKESKVSEAAVKNYSGEKWADEWLAAREEVREENRKKIVPYDKAHESALAVIQHEAQMARGLKKVISGYQNPDVDKTIKRVLAGEPITPKQREIFEAVMGEAGGRQQAILVDDVRKIIADPETLNEYTDEDYNRLIADLKSADMNDYVDVVRAAKKEIKLPKKKEEKPSEKIPKEEKTDEDIKDQAKEETKQIEDAAKEVETEPTEAQIKSGNYRKGHVKLRGFDISIENPKGSFREGKDEQGKPWKQEMKAHYGYFKRTEGKDGDQVDVFLGPNQESKKVFVVNQVNSETGKFDEHKVMFGYGDEEAAKKGYLENYEKGWKGLGSIVAFNVDDFKKWLKDVSESPKKARGSTKAIEPIHEIPEAEYQKQAEKIGIVFNGMQELPGKEAMPMFTDTAETNSTFMVKDGETLEQALEETRKPFREEAAKAEAVKKAQGKDQEASVDEVEKPVKPKPVDKIVKAPDVKPSNITAKEQKRYLVDKLDDAVKKAPKVKDPPAAGIGKNQTENISELIAATKANRERYGTVTIEVPGDGDFTILNTKQTLETFRKKVKANVFSAIQKTATTRKPSEPKPTGKRIIVGSEEGWYYNKFKPRKQKIVEKKPDVTNGGKQQTQQWYDKKNQWFTQGNYIVRVSKQPKTKYLVETEKLPNIERAIPKDTVPAEIRGEFSYQGLNVVHVESSTGIHTIFDPVFFDVILGEHPNAKIFVNKKGMTAVFKKGDNVVGSVAGKDINLKGGVKEGTLEAVLDSEMVLRYEQLYGKPKPVETQKPEVDVSKMERWTDEQGRTKYLDPKTAKTIISGENKGTSYKVYDEKGIFVNRVRKEVLKKSGFKLFEGENAKAAGKKTAEKKDKPSREVSFMPAGKPTGAGIRLNIEEILKKAKKYFGITKELRYGGYIMPDGKMLDFSGIKFGAYRPEGRQMDHREIGYMDENWSGGTLGMQEFEDLGNIRMDYNAGMFNMVHKPTPKQFQALRKFINGNNGEVVVELENGLGKLEREGNYYEQPKERFYKEYDKGAKTETIIGDIKTFYEQGVVKESLARQFHFMVSPTYHGTSAEFDKFRTENIGEGEGAQAFGYGLYFTEEKDIAKHYAKTVNDEKYFELERKIQREYGINEDRVYTPVVLTLIDTAILAKTKKRFEAAIHNYKQGTAREGFTENDYKEYKKGLKAIKDIESGKLKFKKSRQIYKVSLHKGKEPGEYEWLDWYEPTPSDNLSKIKKQADEEGIDLTILDNLNPLAEYNGEDIYSHLASQLRSDKEASLFLLRAGIDGVRYPTGTLSGVKDSKIKNYVVFDEDAVTIDERIAFAKKEGATRGTGIRTADLENFVTPLVKKLSVKPNVIIVEKQADFPADIQAQMKKQNIKRTMGAWAGEDLYFVAENIENTAQAQEVLFHELYGHYGPAKLFGEKFEHFLEQIYHSYGNDGLADIAEKWGFDLSTREGQLNAAREKLALMAHTNENPGLLQKIYTWIKNWLRQYDFKFKITDSDLQDLIAKKVKPFVHEGKVITQVDTRAMFAGKEAFRKQAKPFYSAVTKAVEAKMPDKIAAKSLINLIKKQQGVKQEELDWLGIEEWLRDQQTVTKEQVLDFLQANEIQVEEVVKGKTITEKPIEDAARERFEEEFDLDDYLGGVSYRREEAKKAWENDSHQIWESTGKTKDKYEDYEYFEDDVTQMNAEDIFTEEEILGMTEDAWSDHMTDYEDAIVEQREEEARAESEDTTKFSEYTTPGGENYRELLLTLPVTELVPLQGYEVFKDGEFLHRVKTEDAAQKNVESLKGNPENAAYEFTYKPADAMIETGYKSPHWQEPNPVAHVRFNERVDADGKRTLFIEEIQSDLSSEIRKLEEGAKQGLLAEHEIKRIDDLKKLLPWGDKWYQFTMKRMIRWGAENGFESIAWVTGEQTAERYDLSKHIDKLEYATDGSGGLLAYKGEDAVIDKYDITEETLSDYIGKPAAEKLLAQPEKTDEHGVTYKVLEGLDLKVGGEWATHLYDEMLPKFINKYVKKWGAKVGKGKFHTDPEGTREMGKRLGKNPLTFAVHSLPITPQMKEAALYTGQPMFMPKQESAALSNVQEYANRIEKLEQEQTKSKTRAKTKATMEKDLGTDISTLPGKVVDAWSKRKSGWKVEKPDTSVISRMIATPEHYYEKVPAAKRVFEAATRKTDNAFHFMNRLLETENNESLITPLKLLQKQNTAEYNRLSKLIVHADQNKITYTEEQIKARKFSDLAVKAWSSYRKIMDNGFDALFQQMRQTIEAYKAQGIELPEVAVVVDGEKVAINLEVALAQMGDIRGYYHPRKRRGGRWMLKATKEGSNPILEFFDTKTMINMRHSALASQGYKVQKSKTGKTPEDVFQLAGQTMGIQSVINQALDKLDTQKKPSGWEDFGFKGEWIDKREFVIRGPFSKKHSEVFKKFGGKWYSMEEGTPKVWRFSDATPGIEKKILRALGVVDSSYLDSELLFAQGLAVEVANIIKSRGFRSSMEKRRKGTGKEVWLGYEEDPLKAAVSYVQGISHGMAKKNMAQEMLRAVTGTDIDWKDYGDYDEYLDAVKERRIDAHRQPNIYHDVKVYMEDMLRNEEFSDRVIGTIKGLAVLKYIGGRVSAPLVNLTALVTSVPAAMQGYAKIPIGKTYNLLVNASNDYAVYKGLYGDRKSLPEWKKKVLDEIHDKGWHTAQYNQEALSVLRSKTGAGWTKVMDVSMMAFGATEQLNRVSTIMGSYAGIKANTPKRYFNHAEALEMAKKISDRAHGVYGKISYPHLARGTNAAAHVARMFYVFRKFSHNYLQTMYDLGWNKKSKTGLLYMMASPAVLAGAASSVAWPIVMQALGKLFDWDDPEEAVYEWVEDNMGQYPENFVRYGAFGTPEHGISLKGSLAIGVTDLPTTFADIAGAPGSVLTDIFQGGRSILRGDVLKGTEKILPRALGAPLQAYREKTEGVTTRINAPVFYGREQIRANLTDALYRAFSFNPTQIAEKRERLWKERQVEQKYRDRVGVINARIRKYHAQPAEKRDMATWAEILNDIREHNERIKAKGLTGIIGFYNQASIRRALSSFKPTKRDLMKRKKVFAKRANSYQNNRPMTIGGPRSGLTNRQQPYQ